MRNWNEDKYFAVANRIVAFAIENNSDLDYDDVRLSRLFYHTPSGKYYGEVSGTKSYDGFYEFLVDYTGFATDIKIDEDFHPSNSALIGVMDSRENITITTSEVK